VYVLSLKKLLTFENDPVHIPKDAVANVNNVSELCRGKSGQCSTCTV